MDNNISDNTRAEVTYIKSLMAKSEISYRLFAVYFAFMAIYSILTVFILSIIRIQLYSPSHETGLLLHDVFFNCLYECIFKLISLLPLLIFTLIYYKKVKADGMGLSTWLFSIIGVANIFCGFILPIAAVSVTASYEISDIFFILSSALIIFISGIFTGSRFLKLFSLISFAVPMIILTVVGFYVTYSEYNSIIINGAVAAVLSLIKTVSYIICPALGYIVAALWMKRQSNQR